MQISKYCYLLSVLQGQNYYITTVIVTLEALFSLYGHSTMERVIVVYDLESRQLQKWFIPPPQIHLLNYSISSKIWGYSHFFTAYLLYLQQLIAVLWSKNTFFHLKKSQSDCLVSPVFKFNSLGILNYNIATAFLFSTLLAQNAYGNIAVNSMFRNTLEVNAG